MEVHDGASGSIGPVAFASKAMSWIDRRRQGDAVAGGIRRRRLD
jgi:hypothetical protein